MSEYKFATAINCIDGRVQVPVFNWMDLHCHVQYVDMITEPGADNILPNGSDYLIYSIREKVRLSLERHHSQAIAIVGHHDCLANPISKEDHWQQIRQSANIIESWGYWVRVLGLWVNEWSSIDVVCDSDEEQENQIIKSYL